MPSAHRKHAIARGSAILVLTLLLSACGGGSGGSGSTTQNPTTQPPMPQPIYAGVKNQGTLDLTNSQNYAQEVFAAFSLLNSVGNGWSQSSVLEFTQGTFNGSLGGTLKVTGGANPDRTTWAEETFNNYSSTEDPDTVLNGSLIVQQRPPVAGVNFAGTVGADHYVAKVGGFSYEYNGTFTYSFTNAGYKLTGDFSVRVGSDQFLASGITLTEQNSTGPDFTNLELFNYSGRVYDAAAGYLDVNTAVPVDGGGDFPSIQSDIFPQGNTGDVVLSGGNKTALHFQPLNGFLAFLGLDTGNGEIDYGTRIDRATGAIDATQPTGTSVQALTELPTPATHIGAVTVDGRYSYTPGGWVSYSWQLLSAPLGSAVQVSGTGSTVQFTPDMVGDYLLQLTATSGGKSAIEAVQVNYKDSVDSSTADPPTTQYKVSNYIHAHVGENVTLDGRASPAAGRLSQTDDPSFWTLHTPAGSHAALADSSSFVTSFTPDKPGIYYAIMYYDNGSYLGFALPASAVSIIDVDEGVRFASPATVVPSTAPPFSVYDTARGEFGGIGDGFALMVPVSGSVDNAVETWKPSVDGLFQSNGSTTLENGDSAPLLTADLNGDGVSDLLNINSSSGTPTICSLESWESGAGGYAVSNDTFNGSCDLAYGQFYLMQSSVIAGHPAVTVVDPDHAWYAKPAFATMVENSSGVLQAPVYTGINGDAPGADAGTVDAFALQDVTGDGEPDLIASVTYAGGGTTHTVVEVFKGNGDGSFTYLASYTISDPGATLPIAVADFNGDGHEDIAVAGDTTLEIFYGDGTGSFSSTPETRSLGCEAAFMQAIDVNGDGKPDLVLGDNCSTLSSGYGLLHFYISGASTASGGTTSLGQEQDYPMLNESYWSGWGANKGIAGDYNGDGLQDLLLNETLLLQLPAVTSATVVSANPPLAQVISPASSGTAKRRAWTKTVAGMHLGKPRP